MTYKQTQVQELLIRLLFLTDLPVMVNLSDINYQLTYNES